MSRLADGLAQSAPYHLSRLSSPGHLVARPSVYPCHPLFIHVALVFSYLSLIIFPSVSFLRLELMEWRF